LRPPVPIAQQEANWPLLSISKGFFEGAIAARGGTAALKSGGATGGGSEPVKLAASALQAVDVGRAGAAWGDEDDLQLEEESGEGAAGEDGEPLEAGGADAGWDVDDNELDIPADLVAAAPAASAEEAGFFVAASRGGSLASVWCANSKLPVDHVLAGSFETAMRLLHDQVGFSWREWGVGDGGRTGHVLIWASAPPNTFFFAQIKNYFFRFMLP